LTWAAPPYNGGSAILDYRLYWDKGLNTWEAVVEASAISALTFTKTSGVSSGTTYKFKVQARTGVGYSTDSAQFTILAAKIPETPAVPSTTVNGNYIIVSWTEPTTNGSDIVSYKVYIMHKDTGFSLE
jgi:hypothetical protein